MKKYILICIAFVSFIAMAQEKKTAWDYPVKPGMKEWSQFESLDKMYESCQIPASVLKQLDTHAR
jgi:carbonic anhydrase